MRRKQIFPLIALLLFLAVLWAAGCGKTVVPSRPALQPELMSTERLAGEASQAWMRRDYAKSELYYERLLQRPELDEGSKLVATKRLALSAYYAEHYHQALQSLQDWRARTPEGRMDSEWETCYVDTLQKLDRSDLLEAFFQKLLAAPDAESSLISKTGLALASLYWAQDQHGMSLDTLRRLYAYSADNDEARADLEKRFLQKLEAVPTEQLEKFGHFVTQANVTQFPYTLVSYEQAMRKVRTLEKKELAERWPMLWQAISQAAVRSDLVDRAPLLETLTTLEKELGVPRQGVALLLPLSGRYAPVAWKILKGAGAAQWRISQQGADLMVEVLNTEAPGFEQRLRELPPYFTIVGGPLRREALEPLLDGVQLQGRALFAFMPKLPEGLEEGQGVWKFFTSPSDQVRSLVRLAGGRLGATKFGVLYPREPYGERMAQIFSDEVLASNGTITVSQSYAPSTPTSWGDSIGKMVKTVNATNTTAVFIPDVFSRAKLLIPYFFFFDEGRQLFLGPEIWSQAMAKDRDIDMQYLSLAVSPSAWRPESAGAKKLAEALADDGVGPPDYWSALGYDFIRTAQRIGGLPPRWTPNDINERLAGLNGMEFSLAPFTWNATGGVRQDLYLFQPAASGPSLLDLDRLRYRMRKALENHEWRMETLQKEQKRQQSQGPEEEELPSGSQDSAQ
ncbi:MAG: penicillin-binding protein activator [Desulfovibrionaceae bacterium]